MSLPVTAPSLLILGTDAVLAASPATAVQLAHACMAAGYQAVIPSSWGDELIAARVLDKLRSAEVPLLYCACPLVEKRMEFADSLDEISVATVAPPVATALYLRAAYSPTRPLIAFAGACPAGGDASIDQWLKPDELFEMLASRGIDANAQPTEFDSVLPPDRRRHFSEPGGVPHRVSLKQASRTIDFVEITDDELSIQLAQRLLSHSPALIDVSISVGCACSGVHGLAASAAARARVREGEPPRSPAPVVDHALPVMLDRRTLARVAPVATNGSAVPPPAAPLESEEAEVEASASLPAPERARRSPGGSVRAVLGAMPHSRGDAGRQLPRAYVARRRSSPKGTRASTVRRAARAAGVAETTRRWPLVAGAAALLVLIVVLLLMFVF